MSLLPSKSEQFDRLAEPVRRWIWDKKWREIRDIQGQAFATLLDTNNDVIISAETAGGKTEAAFLPLISQVLQRVSTGGFDLVYIGPLKSLINDQFRRLQDLCDKCSLPVHSWHGDVPQTLKRHARENPRGILLITPESLEALFVKRGSEIHKLFRGTQAIVIDELHALLDNERGIHLRSLLTRVELTIDKKIRRVGLSATLGEMQLVKKYLRPEEPDRVTLLQAKKQQLNFKMQLRSYLQQDSDDQPVEAKQAVANHLFTKLRGTDNLVFVDSRKDVETYADKLRELSNKKKVVNEFFPHHSNLNRKDRKELESRLHSPTPATAVCTSTLELGIDIGDIDCIAQIGAPSSVASLRQRLGRSGRRGEPAKLRIYSVEYEVNSRAKPVNRLYLKTIRSIAMLQLLINRWCEPPARHALHLSTLVHQILSIIAEHNGSKANLLYATLCRKGPFNNVSPELFAKVLRHLGTAKFGKGDGTIIEQGSDGQLYLGAVGEQEVNSYRFFPSFDSNREYQVIADGKELGTLPINNNAIKVGMAIIFSGRRWLVTEIDKKRLVIILKANQHGKAPTFLGNSGSIDDRIAEKMLAILSATKSYQYLDQQATDILQMARAEFNRLALDQNPICHLGGNDYLIATGVGTIKTTTLALALDDTGVCKTDTYDGFISVTTRDNLSLIQVLGQIAESTASNNLISKVAPTEKFHRLLSSELLLKDALSSRIDLDSLQPLITKLLKDVREVA